MLNIALFSNVFLSVRDKDKFVQLYETYCAKMLAVAFNIVKNKEDAEDVVHDVFVNVSKHLDDLSEVDSYKTSVYLVVSTRNTAINFSKKKSNKNLSIDKFDFEIKDIEDVEEKYISSDLSRIIIEKILALPPKYAEIMKLRYISDLSFKAISKILGVSAATCRTRARRAKAELQTVLREELYEE